MRDLGACELSFQLVTKDPGYWIHKKLYKFAVAYTDLVDELAVYARPLPITMGELTAHSVHRSEQRSEKSRRWSFMAVLWCLYVRSIIP